jgi:hypothetical protein
VTRLFDLGFLIGPLLLVLARVTQLHKRINKSHREDRSSTNPETQGKKERKEEEG